MKFGQSVCKGNVRFMDTSILIVDDNMEFCESLSSNFQRFGYRCFLASDFEGASANIVKHGIELILLDVMLGSQNGLGVLTRVLEIYPQIPVIMITGYASIEGAVQAIKIGAFDYVQKPIQFDRLMKLIDNAVSFSKTKNENRILRDRLIARSVQIVTRNESMLDLMQKAKRLAQSELPVLICGENGTGKEIFADFIHLSSPRSPRPFVKINCAAFPESLLDNELFGHERGAFTGADSVFKGVFERAAQGTLFLDEIGDMSTHIQAKILRALQNHEIRHLGGNNTISVDVRFIAATNKDLEPMIRERSFREDLLYRLNAATLRIPPLRERREDIPLLVEHFLHEFGEKKGEVAFRLSEAVMERFMEHDWPGNVRELRNTVMYAATLATTSVIETDSLPASICSKMEDSRLQGPLRETERNLLVQTLQRTHYNKVETARILKISRSTLYNKLAKYGISG